MHTSDLSVRLAANRVPGAAISQRRAGEWTQAVGGLRDVGRQLSVQIDTPFEVGSLSKPVFALAVLQLVEEGAIELDAPLDRYLHPTDLADPTQAQRITPRQLLSHTSGLPNWRPGRWTGRPGPLALVQPPGYGFVYSGEGYQLLQAVVEAVCGRSLEAVMRARVFDPLRMATSTYEALPSYPGSIARGYTAAGAVVPAFDPSLTEALAAASMKSTLPDLIRFIDTLVSPDARERLQLPASPFDLFWTPQVVVAPGLGWSLGWGLETRSEGTVAWHWCSTRASFWAFVGIDVACGDAFVGLTNAPGGRAVCRALLCEAIGGEHPAFLHAPMGPSTA